MPPHYTYVIVFAYIDSHGKKKLKHASMIPFFFFTNYCKLFSKCKELFLSSEKGLANTVLEFLKLPVKLFYIIKG